MVVQRPGPSVVNTEAGNGRLAETAFDVTDAVLRTTMLTGSRPIDPRKSKTETASPAEYSVSLLPS